MAESLALPRACIPLHSSCIVYQKHRRTRLFVKESDRERWMAESSSPQVLTCVTSLYNAITIIDVPESSPSFFSGWKLLTLDNTGNIHSVYNKSCKWSGSYWDYFACLPPIVPEGPIGILGLGGGTAARLMLDLFPERRLHGWEIDEILIDEARRYLALGELEGVNDYGGGLEIYIGDALSDAAYPEGGFAGIVVDLFSNGDVLPALRDPETWFKLRERLKCGGRIMINCVEEDDAERTAYGRTYKRKPVLWAMLQAFPDEVQWQQFEAANNKMALTGKLPVLNKWADLLPEKLKGSVFRWKPFS